VLKGKLVNSFVMKNFGGSNIVLQGYVDVDMASDRDNRRSTTGYVFTIGGIIFIWI